MGKATQIGEYADAAAFDDGRRGLALQAAAGEIAA
jgi:hypothetical protein